MEFSEMERREVDELLSKPLAHHLKRARNIQHLAIVGLICNVVIIAVLYGYPNALASKILPYCIALAIASSGIAWFSAIADRRFVRILFHLASRIPDYSRRDVDDDMPKRN